MTAVVVSRVVPAQPLRRQLEALSGKVQVTFTARGYAGLLPCEACEEAGCADEAFVSWREASTGHAKTANVGAGCVLGYVLEHVLPHADDECVHVDIGTVQR